MQTKFRIERLEHNSQEIQRLPMFAAVYDPATDMWTATSGKGFTTEQEAVRESLRQPILPLYVGAPYSD